ncbi:MAG TPA: glycosyltransferase family 2 protein [Gemmataceae bacterium]|nr:glycosyltransferase family 2 protein [Gemmataceae bacterium]
MPRVSVIVPVRNEAGNIRRTLLDLARQDFPKHDYEILVVDGSSEDGTPGIVRALLPSTPNLRLFDNPRRLASAARNIGVRRAAGEFLVIVDGHCRVRDPLYLRRIVEAFEESGSDTLGRPQPLRADSPTPFQRAVAAARRSWLGHNPDSAIFSDVARFVPADNVAVAYRREVFDTVGLFDESFDACEDVEFNTRVRRAGLTCYFTPATAVEYQPRGTLGGLAYQMMRYGRGRARLGKKDPATVTVPGLVPPVWLVWLAVGPLLGVLSMPLAVLFAASLAAYALLVLAESVRVWRADRVVSLAWLPLVFATVHAGFGWGYLREAAAGLAVSPLGVPQRLLPSSRRLLKA